MEYYNNILCISKPELTNGDALAKDSREWPVISEAAYDQYIYRSPLIRLRRGCKNTSALLSYEQLRRDIKDKVVAKYGDPYKITPHNLFTDSIKADQQALQYFRNYRFDSGRALPEQNITEYYTNAILLNTMHSILNSSRVFVKSRQGSTKHLWERMCDIIIHLDTKAYPHTLPSNHRRLKDKYRMYLRSGYERLIHSAFCNKNTEKINDLGKMWMLARWANQVDRVTCEQQMLEEYNEKATAEGWKTIKSTGPIHAYLHRVDIKPLWWGYRFGELKSKEKFAMQISTEMPSMRDSLWYSDGTKLNYYYLTPEGKIETCQVYEVMDTFSEVLLGYHVSPTEDYQAQYHAYKMALKTAGHKPYQVTFDNQGGHKKLEAGEFFQKLAHLAIKTQPYNGKSKTIESAFNRFQQHFLKKDWFFTGQNIQAKREESKANLEFIMFNKANLPTLDEVKAVYKKRREEWNHAAHPSTNNPRIETYYASFNEKSPKVDEWDMVDLFWITRKDPITCRAYGITFQEKNITYDYLKYISPTEPDQEWLRNNIDKKFIIKFDPDDMGMIYLYEKDITGIRFVTTAETKITVHRGKQEQEDGEAALITHIIEENKRLRLEGKEKMEEILKDQGQDAESYGLSTPPLKGIEKTKSKKRKKEIQYADTDKVISNLDPLSSNDDTLNVFDLY